MPHRILSWWRNVFFFSKSTPPRGMHSREAPNQTGPAQSPLKEKKEEGRRRRRRRRRRRKRRGRRQLFTISSSGSTIKYVPYSHIVIVDIVGWDEFTISSAEPGKSRQMNEMTRDIILELSHPLKWNEARWTGLDEEWSGRDGRRVAGRLSKRHSERWLQGFCGVHEGTLLFCDLRLTGSNLSSTHPIRIRHSIQIR